MSTTGKLNDKVRIRDFKLNAILDIATAINSNLTVDGLLLQYENILKEQLAIERLKLYAVNTGWQCILKFGGRRVTPDFFQEDYVFRRGTGWEDVFDEQDIIIPISQNEQPIAYLVVGDDHEDKISVSPVIKHMKFIQTITNLLVVAIQNRNLQEENLKQERVKRELELAAEMQAMLLPGKLPRDKYFEVSAYYKAHQQVGGDYYDFFMVDDDEAVFCMADVSGKGITAAFVMAGFQAYLRSVFSHGQRDLKEAAIELNNRVFDITKGEKFITLFLALYNIKTRSLQYVNCGHNPPLLYCPDEGIQLLQANIPGLGMIEKLPAFRLGSLNLLPGSIAVTFTDGLIEIENTKMEEYGTDRLSALLLKCLENPVAEMNRQILNNVNAFREDSPYPDDIAILSCRFH
ncbi:MAG: PP2C family protein-serine/threonine phosphatase [Flavobacteriales bacterium]